VGKFTRSFPANYSVLAVFTLCESYMVSLICGMYTPESVLLSAVATLSATLGLTYHAMTTEEDYTSYRSGAKGKLCAM
jgi:FtsH-binding integral membrane protein